MLTDRMIRQKRLENEHKELMELNDKYDFIKVETVVPYAEYRITYYIRTIVSGNPLRYRDSTTCVLKIPAGYPAPSDPPGIWATTTPYPFHPNWFPGGKLCTGYYESRSNFQSTNDCLSELIVRAAHVLAFDPAYVNLSSVANRDAETFWNCNRSKFPSDTRSLSAVRSTAPVIPRIAIKF